MDSSFRWFPSHFCLAALMVAAGIALSSCESSPQKPASPSDEFDRAKVAFKSSELDKALELTDKMAVASPPATCTQCARVLRAVIYTGELKCAKELEEAYGKGSEKSKNPQFQNAYRRLHNDNLEAAEQAALNLAETTHQFNREGQMPKEVMLEANFPSIEGPTEIPQLAQVEQGAWVEPDQQDSAAVDALHKGVDDALADAVGGDRAKARQALANGSTTLTGAAFAIFLAHGLADGATMFDRHHGRDSMKMKTLCDQGDLTLKAAAALLKDNPNKDEATEVKKLQDKFKTILKNT